MSWSSFFGKKKRIYFEIYIDSHVGFHKVIFNINKYKFTKTVNSYHNEAIKLKKVLNTNIFVCVLMILLRHFILKKRKF